MTFPSVERKRGCDNLRTRTRGKRTFNGGRGHMAQSMYKCPVPCENAVFFTHFCHSEPVNGALGCRFLKKISMDCFLAKNAVFCCDQGKHREKLLWQNSRDPENTHFGTFPCLSGFVGFYGIRDFD